MRKQIYWILGLWVLFPIFGQAQTDEGLRTVPSVFVEDGKIVETGVLSDSSGQIFIELTKDSLVGSELDGREFNGEILAPEIAAPLAKAPRGRMREIVSFDLFTDRADTAIFVDRYAMMHERTRLREQVLYGDSFERTSGGQVLMRLYQDQNIGKAALWHYDRESAVWKRIGGLTANSNEPDVEVFSAIIFQTGSYTIWDEDPSPEFSLATDPALVETVEPSPFPSVVASEETTENTESFASESIASEEQPFTADDNALFDQPVPAVSDAPLNFAERQPVGLIPAVGLSPADNNVEDSVQSTDSEVLDDTPPNQFSSEFLETIESTRSSAPPQPTDANGESFAPPVGATLPSTGNTEQPINWLNYLAFVLMLGVIGGSVWLVKQKPY